MSGGRGRNVSGNIDLRILIGGRHKHVRPPDATPVVTHHPGCLPPFLKSSGQNPYFKNFSPRTKENHVVIILLLQAG